MYENYLNNKFTNAVVMYVMLMGMCLIIPFFLIFKFIYTIISYRSPHHNMPGKVVLITGASSGIGEYMAYEYAKKGANLVLVARREGRLSEVAERARGLGSPDVLLICADVSNFNDCRRFVDETINHFGRLDHLINNAGVGSDYSVDTDVTKFAPIMDINFWGSIYPTYFAIPHLRKIKGKIVVNSSSAALLHPPKAGFYGASKAALISFYESLRFEVSPTITITIVTLGFIDTEIIKGKHMFKEGVFKDDARLKYAVINSFPVMSAEPCAKAIVDGTIRGKRYITEPQFMRVLILLKFLCPEIVDWGYKKIYLANIAAAKRRRNKMAFGPQSQTKAD